MTKTLGVFLTFSFFISAHTLYAQDKQYKDARLWMSLNIEKKITRKMAVEWNSSLRFYENYSRVGKFYTELGLSRKLTKGLKITGYYRFARRNNFNNTFSTVHRIYLDLEYKRKVTELIKFTGRVRYQRQYVDMNSSQEGHYPKTHIRLRAGVEINLGKRYTPYTNFEIFYRLSGGRYYHLIDEYRWKTGVIYEINKRNSFKLYYMIIKDINYRFVKYNISKSTPAIFYVTGITYYYSF